jgi:nitroimidazol reductase NimA-like FMN-containing flavoprotein (pyridoxamine 5'-phosphate oxidase superfamily)
LRTVLFTEGCSYEQVPKKCHDLLDRPTVILLATLLSDGMPQVWPVWCSYDGDHILVHTEKDRQ